MKPTESQRRGRLRLLHLREATEAVDEVMAGQRERFERLANPDAAPRVVSSFNLFQTPPEVAAQLVALLTRHGRTLEPSAGLGRLYRAVRQVSDYEIVLVEQAAECCGELFRATEGDERARLVQGDFLGCTVEQLGTFDCVVMNPPFKMGRDIKHINHARTFLRPGGQLVAICADGPKQRAKLKPIADRWVELPAGTFAKEGTQVAAAIAIFVA